MNNRSHEQGKTTVVLLGVVLLVSLAIGPKVFADVGQGQGVWETWSAESYTMAPRESFQLRVNYKDIPTRRWLLVADGGDINCDLSVLRVNGEELLYYKIDERRHEVSIPWGKGEEIILVLTNRTKQGAVVVSLLGPPKEENLASYSYLVNRALEAYTSGQRLKAQALCQDALKDNPDDGVAKVLLAGFMREVNRFDDAEAMIKDALAHPLPEEMKVLAEELVNDLKALRAPIPQVIRDGLAQAESAMANNEPQVAMTVCDNLLQGSEDLTGSSRARLQVLRGRALENLGRNFEAIDAFTQALSYDRSKSAQALAYFHMGELYLKMENLAQAEGAFTISLKFGLPTGLEVQARESLQLVNERLTRDR